MDLNYTPPPPPQTNNFKKTNKQTPKDHHIICPLKELYKWPCIVVSSLKSTARYVQSHFPTYVQYDQKKKNK